MARHSYEELRNVVPFSTWGPKGSSHTGNPGTPADVKALKNRVIDPHGAPCGQMAGTTRKWVQRVESAGAHCRDEGLMKGQYALVMAGAGGHTGVETALAELLAAYLVHRVPTMAIEPRDEWDEALAGGWADAAGSVNSATLLDPCAGAPGAGIEVMVDPGEGKRAVTLIVDGLADARFCADHAGEGVGVIGLAGRESYRRDGIPVNELDIVAGTAVVIVFGPEVRDDLDHWNSATGLQRAVEARRAKGAAFAQPPGTEGVRVGDYLEALPDATSRAEALAYMISNVDKTPATPKPKARKNVLGGDLESELPPTNDTVLGTTWADEHRGQFRYLATDRSWLRYLETGRWTADGAEAELGASVMEYLDEVGGPLAAAAANADDSEKRAELRAAYDALQSSRKQSAVEIKASKYRPVHVRRDQLDRHPRVWCASNAIINLDTGEVAGHNPDLLLTAGSDVPYVRDHKCERFDQFLAEALPDEDVRAYVLRLFFLAMYGEVIEHIFPAFVGEGRNGKGTLIRIMEKVFGAAFAPVNASSLLERKFEKHEEEIAHLAGKRLVVCQEPTKGARWDAERIKSWTGGDTLTGRPMHGHRFAFAPSHTLIMVSNTRPNVDGDSAFWARYHEVPFTQSFAGREDYGMEPHILAKELPGVLNRLLEAGQAYRALGKLSEPAAVVVATEGARIEADHLARFATDHVRVTNEPAGLINNAEMHRRLGDWWRANEIPFTELPKIGGTFRREMQRALGFAADAKNPRKVKVDGASVLNWVGVEWITEAEEVGNQVGNQVGNPPPWKPPSVAYQDPGAIDLQDRVADLQDRVADRLPTSNDQGVGIAPGKSGAVAEVAEVADFGLHIAQHRGSENKNTPPSPEDPSLLAGSGGKKERVGNLGNSATVSDANEARPCPACDDSAPIPPALAKLTGGLCKSCYRDRKASA